MEDDVAVLARCVGDVDAFAQRHWGRRPLLRRAAGSFDDLLGLDAVESLLVATARRPTFRLVRDGATVPPAEYTTKVRLGSATVDDAADVSAIAGQVALGATLVLQALHRTSLPLMELCRALERATSHPVQANAYLSPGGTPGLGRHRDDHDVLVLQVEGSKGWDVDGLGPFDLAAGDVLYLPGGTEHAATATAGPSLHITIGFLRVTYRHVLRRVLAAAEADLDDPLPLGFAHGDGRARLAAGLAARFPDVARYLDKLDPADVAACEADRAVRRRPPARTGMLRSVLAAASADDTTRLRRRPDAPARLRDGDGGDDDDRIVLELSDRTVHLPRYTRPALEAVLAVDGAFPVGALTGLDEPSRAVLARRLVREGWLEVVADEPLSRASSGRPSPTSGP